MRARVSFCCIVVFCLWLPFWCVAGEVYTPVFTDPVAEPWRWRNEEALSNIGVLCMDEASDGTLWFGCVGSIARYDGTTVEAFPFEEEFLSLIGYGGGDPVWAKAIMALPDDELLVLVHNSLVHRTKEGRWRVVIANAGESNFSARLAQTPQKTVLLFLSGGLWEIDAKGTAGRLILKPEASVRWTAFCLDERGALWLVERKENHSELRMVSGLNLDSVRYPIPFSIKATEEVIAADAAGNIWYGSHSDRVGLRMFEGQRRTWREPEMNVPMNCFSVSVLKNGTVFGTGFDELISVFPTGKGALYSFGSMGLPLVPFSLTETADNRLWLIGRIGYVYSIDLGEDEWKTYAGLNFQCEGKNGVQWFSSFSQKHAVCFDPNTGQWRRYGTEDHGLDKTFRIIQSSHGLIWAAGVRADRAAISVFNGTEWQRLLHPEFAVRVEVNSLFEAMDGTVWCGAGGNFLDRPNGGALQFEVLPDRSVVLKKHHAFPDFPYYVTAINQTPDGVLWLGSTVVHRFDGSSSRAEPVPGLAGENTTALVVDRAGTLWAAKQHAGVCRWNGTTWELFSVEDGIDSLLVTDLLLLQDGTLLLSTDKGISRYDGFSWTPDAYPEVFAMPSQAGHLRQTRNGSIWLNYSMHDMDMRRRFPEWRGFCAIRHKPETCPPDTEVLLFLEKVAHRGTTRIEWSGQDVLNQTLKSELYYSWRVNGGEWSAFSRGTGKTFSGLRTGSYTFEVRARDRAFNVDPTPAHEEFTVIPPVWRQLWFISLISVLTGLIASLIWLLIRVRERHLIERQEEREQHLIEQQQEKEKHHQEMDRLKTGFFTNISHELRTPMTVVSGRLETIFDAETDAKRKNSLLIVLRNAQRVSTLITQLLDFRKIEEGKIKLEPTLGDLAMSLRDWVASLQVLADKAGLTLVPDIPERCCGEFDFDKLQKIFTNLIANSIKYTKSGGEVRVVLKNEADHAEARQMVFTVEDNGVGIPPEHISHIFDRFYRVSEESMAVGAGIGLNLTKELVELLGGTIQVESPIHPDATRPGSRFTVRLPVEQGASGEGRGAVESGVFDQSDLVDRPDRTNQPCDSAEEAPLLLIVEDDEDVRSFIVEGLEPFYRIGTAQNGAVGLQKAKETVPDLVVTDIMMPVMDGVALCRELKTSLETSHIPVIMLTAKTALESQIEGLKTGADDYISKPFHMELLQVRIANLLESRRVLREQFFHQKSELTLGIPEYTLDKEFFEKTRCVLEENYSDWDFRTEEFASALNMSPSTLFRKIKAVTGRTPSAFINEFRMVKAAELLITTTKPVTEIVFETGGDEPANFTRMFKKHFKMSPLKYRAAHRPS